MFSVKPRPTFVDVAQGTLCVCLCVASVVTQRLAGPRVAMLRLFLVNEGRYLDVEGELTPNSRSREGLHGLDGESVHIIYTRCRPHGGVCNLKKNVRDFEISIFQNPSVRTFSTTVYLQKNV